MHSKNALINVGPTFGGVGGPNTYTTWHACGGPLLPGGLPGGVITGGTGGQEVLPGVAGMPGIIVVRPCFISCMISSKPMASTRITQYPNQSE